MSLPLWLQITGLIAGLLWPLYQLYSAISGPKLEVRLTKDLFFRFINLGECLFTRSILIAEHGNVLITDVAANLVLISAGKSKSWELEFLKFGEVMTDKNVEPLFCYSSSSPFRFLSRGVPVQAVYLSRPKDYGEVYSSIVREFLNKLTPLRNEAAKLISDPNQKEQEQLQGRVSDLSRDYAAKIADKIQLEAGQYKIELCVTYKSIRGINSYFKHKSKSSISFVIENDARDQIKSALPNAIQRAALNVVFNADLVVEYPEYAPVNIKEDAVT